MKKQDSLYIYGINTGLLIAMVVWMLFLHISFDTEKTYEVSKEENCIGIDYWFTNTSFMNDYKEAKRTYRDSYNSKEIREDGVDPVWHLTSGLPFNCEDWTNLISCLGDLYQIKCRTFHVDYLESNIGHQGIECKIQNGWVELG